ncbi:hypothetical protein SBA5_30155 [Candidatus Sulfotelmatomonas gaucii]|uniref:Uncharacterized protein n=1 Tax=Candidatus Sulfuritelmatomonas gaucii TaxID=2043161 RepID=A0A2N9LCE7_9BACT|nr:hypothetical protein SBA5_30155 [Candidatus Sulfotelmatomonas gaucii]
MSSKCAERSTGNRFPESPADVRRTGRKKASGRRGKGPGIAPVLQHFLQGTRSSVKVVSLLDGNILPLGTITFPPVSKIGVTNPIPEAGYV